MKHYTQPMLRIADLNAQDVLTASKPEWQDDPFASANSTTEGGI